MSKQYATILQAYSSKTENKELLISQIVFCLMIYDNCKLTHQIGYHNQDKNKEFKPTFYWKNISRWQCTLMLYFTINRSEHVVGWVVYNYHYISSLSIML
jgi:hypothetical protein